MTLNNSDTVRVRVSINSSLGETISAIRTWLDSQNIKPENFTSSIGLGGYHLAISFQTSEQAGRFREWFRTPATLKSSRTAAAPL
jgi:hypothetical protein